MVSGINHLFFPIVYFLTNVHFTFAACIPAALSFLNVLYFTRNKNEAGFLTVLGASLFSCIVSVLFRPEVFYLGLLLFLPVLAIRFVQLAGNRVMRLCLVYSYASLTLLASLLYYTNRNYCQNQPEWKSFIEYFNERSMFTDCVLPYDTDAAAAASWSKNDYNLITHWFHADSSVFSTRRMMSYVNWVKCPDLRKSVSVEDMPLDTFLPGSKKDSTDIVSTASKL